MKENVDEAPINAREKKKRAHNGQVVQICDVPESCSGGNCRKKHMNKEKKKHLNG